jgi:transposase-like protein
MLRDYPWIIVRFRCHHCERSRNARLAILAARFGPNTMIEELLRIFMGR